MAQNAGALAIQYFFGDIFGGVAKFPVWWYSRGLAHMTKWVTGSMATANRYFGVGVWIKNIFVPMYGDASWQGRIISVFMRLFMILVRGIGLILWTIIALLLFAVYLLVLPLSILGILYHAGGMVIG